MMFLLSEVMSLDPFITAARKHVSHGKKSLSVAQSLDLAAQVSAVNLGLKPALLYDTNAATPEQVTRYLRSLQSDQLVSDSLHTLHLNDNTLIFNQVTLRSNLQRILNQNSMIVIDVCQSLETPAIIDGPLRGIAQDLLCLLEGQIKNTDETFYVPEKSHEWNLCTVFGLLLGYPATYWFDQTKSFENCLSMTPLSVTTASATLHTHRFSLYSFSVPAALCKYTQAAVEDWKLHLQKGFQQQNVLEDLTISHSAVTLPSVCL
ncbi:UPF0739 protein C1orf74 homolog [Neosynchiropus ocellatus]